MRVAITGIGGDIGTGVALRLDRDPAYEVIGTDIEPPRRRLINTVFYRVEPDDMASRARLIREFDPHVIVHLGVYEPHARSNPAAATTRTRATTASVFAAAADCPSLQRVVIRSSVSIYGRGRRSALRPDESSPLKPTSRFGRSLLEVERMASEFQRQSGVEITNLRFAPIVGPYISSALGRYLRLPIVPFSAPVDAPLQLVHIDDVHEAIVTAIRSKVSGNFNIVGEGAVTAVQAAQFGHRIPVPVIGPGWLVARAFSAIQGAPLPDHMVEAMTRGLTADASKAKRELGFVPVHTTKDCATSLFNWASIIELPVERETVA